MFDVDRQETESPGTRRRARRPQHEAFPTPGTEPIVSAVSVGLLAKPPVARCARPASPTTRRHSAGARRPDDRSFAADAGAPALPLVGGTRLSCLLCSGDWGYRPLQESKAVIEPKPGRSVKLACAQAALRPASPLLFFPRMLTVISASDHAQSTGYGQCLPCASTV